MTWLKNNIILVFWILHFVGIVGFALLPDFFALITPYHLIIITILLLGKGVKKWSIKLVLTFLALWGIGQFSFSGDAPYLHLPSSGNDMRNRIGRGYVGGRFRGNSWITAEAEYRYPISKSGLLSGVVFGNATTTSRGEITIGTEVIEKLRLFEAIRPAGGAGLRLLLERAGRLNLGMDFAIGQNGSKGFYFVVGETF